MLATSNSWRRFVSQGMTPVCEPITQNDGHPDLHFRNGGPGGPDARLIAAVPELLAALKLCAAVCAGETMNKNGLIHALESARAAIAKATEPA